MTTARFFLSLSLAALAACDGSDTNEAGGGGQGAGASGPSTTATASTASAASNSTATNASSSTGTGGGPELPDSVDVTFSDNGAGGLVRVNFAVPLVPGKLTDETLVRVVVDGQEVPRATRGLARYGDQSFRSVQIQIDVDPSVTQAATVGFGEAPGVAALTLEPVESTLVSADGESGPLVYTLLPASWLSTSGVAGPVIPEADVAGTDLDAWTTHCDYEAFDTEAFISQGAATTRAVWLYDRGTAMYLGYARRGTVEPLASAYREVNMFRNRITGTGTGARNGIPEGAASDPKYQYAQNLAIHYLLSGDDRAREAAEAMALGMTELWPSPEYNGGSDSWTERNAGFALLAYTWAAVVTDDQSATLWAAADEAAAAYLAIQATYPAGYDDPDARCFAHHGDAHDPSEGNPYFGCSPWMSAILADGLDAYGRERGGQQGTDARAALVKLGRIIARDGLDGTGNPYYWMGVGTSEAAVDDYLEHVGESAYTVAMAWAYDGKTDTELRAAADALVAKFKNEGEVGQLRSFNWQCRSAVMTPTFLAP